MKAACVDGVVAVGPGSGNTGLAVGHHYSNRLLGPGVAPLRRRVLRVAMKSVVKKEGMGRRQRRNNWKLVRRRH